MKIIPDFASMSEENLFQVLKLGVARLFMLCIAELAIAKEANDFWILTSKNKECYEKNTGS